MATVAGERVHAAEPHLLKPGQYGKWAQDGCWYAVPPGTDLLAGLAKHQVTEHDDGTISVAPSILVRGGARGSWHGFLERGIWREC